MPIKPVKIAKKVCECISPEAKYAEDLVRLLKKPIEEIGDYPINLVLDQSEPDNPKWKTIEKNGKYLYQANLKNGEARLLSGDGKLAAYGSKSAMKEKMRRLQNPDFFEPGDILGVERWFNPYSYEHYAVYLGNQRVIHFAPKDSELNFEIFSKEAVIHEAPLEKFLGSRLNSEKPFVVWFDPYNHYRPIKMMQGKTNSLHMPDLYERKFQEKMNWKNFYSAEEVVKRARSKVGTGQGEYNLWTNNCEHFAMWCKTGESRCSQMQRFVGLK